MHINLINNSQTNFEARCFNAKRRKYNGMTPRPLYRRKPKPKLQPQQLVSQNIDNKATRVFADVAYDPDYDWKLDTNHIRHGKEVEPPDEFFEALCEWYSHSKNAGAGILYDESDDLYMDEEWWSQD